MIDNIILDDINFIYHKLNNIVDLSKLSNSDILITGGTGLFGKSIINFFLKLREYYNFNVTILTRDKHSFLSSNRIYNTDFIYFIEGDIRNFNCDKEYNYIIHAATPASDKLEKENPDEMYSIILDGTKNIINIASKMNVNKLLFTSSGAVYGEQFENIKAFNEQYEGEPITYYGKAKKLSEKLFLDSNINVSIARCFAFVGPYLNLDIHFAIGNFIRDVIENRDIIIKGDGRPLRSYLYTADLVIWLFTILLNSNNKTIYNVGSSAEISIYDLAKLVSNSIYNYTGNINVLTKPDYSSPTPKYLPDNTKIIKEFGVQENYSLEESIKRTIEFNINRSK